MCCLGRYSASAGLKPENSVGKDVLRKDFCISFLSVKVRGSELVMKCVNASLLCLGTLRYLFRNLVNTASNDS